MPVADVAKGSVLLTPRFDNLEATITRQLEAAMGRFNGSPYGQRAGAGFSAGFSAKVGAVAGVVQAAATRAFDAIAGSLDAAIARVDTLNNFPRVMQNLGYGADEAQASIDRLSAAIDGMPTSLDSIVSMTQQLAPMCGGLDEATGLSIALNNAFLAGGASTYDQSRAMQQYTQMLAKGKPELEDWRTLQEVMPGQLNQIAQALLGTAANSNDLFEAMKSGSVSMDDFNAAVVSLNEEGVNGFASFEQQARDSTQGIGTALENVSNRISKAVGTVIEAIGPENISGAINAFSSSFAPVAERVAGCIEAAKPYIEDFANFIVGNGPAVATAVAGMAGAFTALQVVKTISGPLSTFGTAIGIVMTSIRNVGVITTAADSFKLLGTVLSGALGGPVGIAVAAIAAVVSALAFFFTQTETGRRLWQQFCDFLSPYIQQASDAVLGAVQAAWPVVQSVISSVMGAVQGVVQAVWPAVQQLFAVSGTAIATIVQGVWPIIQSIITGVMGVIQIFITTAWPVIQNAFALAGTAITTVVNAVWPVVQAVVTTVMGAIQTVVTAVWPIVQAAFTTACGTIQGIVDAVFPAVQAVVSSVMSAINAVISAVMAVIQGDWEGAWNSISTFLSGAWEGMKGAVSGAIDGIVAFVGELPGRIIGALGDLGGLLLDAGSSIIDGLLKGMKSAAEGLFSWVGGIADTIASLKGPLPYDRKLLVPAGLAIMGGLQASLASGFEAVKGDLARYTADIGSMQVPAAAAPAYAAAPDGARGGGADPSALLERLHEDLLAIYGVIPEGMSERDRAREVRRYA